MHWGERRQVTCRVLCSAANVTTSMAEAGISGSLVGGSYCSLAAGGANLGANTNRGTIGSVIGGAANCG